MEGRNVPPKGEKLRRRGGFPTWSWTSLVDQIKMCPPKPQGGNNFTLSRFYVDDGSKPTPIRVLLERALESSCLTIPEHGPIIVVEGRVAEVCLRATNFGSSDGVYAHAPLIEKPLRRLRGRVRIDDDDPDILSRIGHQTWQAVELMSNDGYGAWMLIDIHSQSARRIGIIQQGGEYGYRGLSMCDLPTQNMTIRIE